MVTIHGFHIVFPITAARQCLLGAVKAFSRATQESIERIHERGPAIAND
jgi:hypothetical protein